MPAPSHLDHFDLDIGLRDASCDLDLPPVRRAIAKLSSPSCKQLSNSRWPRVILAASGMATGGRVLHHLKAMAPNPRHHIVFPGFQVAGTRGAKLVVVDPRRSETAALFEHLQPIVLDAAARIRDVKADGPDALEADGQTGAARPHQGHPHLPRRDRGGCEPGVGAHPAEVVGNRDAIRLECEHLSGSALDRLRRAVALHDLHAVGDAAHVDVRGRRALAGEEALGRTPDRESGWRGSRDDRAACVRGRATASLRHACSRRERRTPRPRRRR